MINWSRHPHFSEAEFVCRCGCGIADMDASFMDHLSAVRAACGFALTITSGYRCADHNRRVKGGPAHPTGKAADVAVRGSEALQLATLASRHGFTGIGVNQRGAGRFIHLDTLAAGETAAPRPWLWSY